MTSFSAVVLVIAAVAAGGSLLLIKIGNMMTPGAGPDDRLMLAALGAIVVSAGAGLVLAFRLRPAASAFSTAAAIALMAGAAFVPHAADWDAKATRGAKIAADQRAQQAKFLGDLQAREQDIEARIAARRPYTPEEAAAFLAFVRRSNLSYVSGPDHMPVAMALLQRALEAKILDPNAPVMDWVMPPIGRVPLYLRLHRELRQQPDGSVLTQDWNILLLLIASGADLSIPLAAPVAADLRKTAMPEHKGLYLRLR